MAELARGPLLSVRRPAVAIATAYQVKAAAGYIHNAVLTATNTAVAYLNFHDTGSQYVTNGTFASDTSWTKGTGWTIAAGVATKTAGSATELSQSISITAGNIYTVIFTMTRTAGTLTVDIGGTNGTARSASETYMEHITAGSTDSHIAFEADAAFAGTVDNVFVLDGPVWSAALQDSSNYISVPYPIEVTTSSGIWATYDDTALLSVVYQ